MIAAVCLYRDSFLEWPFLVSVILSKVNQVKKKKTLVELPRVRLNGPELDVFVIIFGYIMDSQRNELSFALIAHLVEHFTGIAEVKGSSPVQFFLGGALFAQLLKLFT